MTNGAMMARDWSIDSAMRLVSRDVDAAIVELWKRGIRSQGEIGRCVGLDQRSVSRRIARLVRRGAWPFSDRPTRGRSQVPVAVGFVAVPVRQFESEPAPAQVATA
jgi:hypothetical protein